MQDPNDNPSLIYNFPSVEPPVKEEKENENQNKTESQKPVNIYQNDEGELSHHSITDSDEPKENETKPNDLMYGITYDEYKQKYQSLGTNFKQCGYCLKFFKNNKKGFITKNLQGIEDEEYICYHCLFWVNYSLELRSTVDGMYEKTIHDYILECSPTHDQSLCIHPGECFVCDYLNGTRIIGIFGEDELFVERKSKEQNIDDMRFVIMI